MQLKTIAGLVLAALVVTGTGAALPGNAPAQADEQANDDDETANATEPRADSEDANESAGRPDDVPAANDGERGPPTEMPEAVPDFVSEIHSLIDQKMAGELEGSLGEQISDLTPDDGDSEESDDESTEAADDDASDADDAEAEDDESTDAETDSDDTETETADESTETADDDTDTETDSESDDAETDT